MYLYINANTHTHTATNTHHRYYLPHTHTHTHKRTLFSHLGPVKLPCRPTFSLEKYNVRLEVYTDTHMPNSRFHCTTLPHPGKPQVFAQRQTDTSLAVIPKREDIPLLPHCFSPSRFPVGWSSLRTQLTSLSICLSLSLFGTFSPLLLPISLPPSVVSMWVEACGSY